MFIIHLETRPSIRSLRSWIEDRVSLKGETNFGQPRRRKKNAGEKHFSRFRNATERGALVPTTPWVSSSAQLTAVNKAFSLYISFFFFFFFHLDRRHKEESTVRSSRRAPASAVSICDAEGEIQRALFLG